MPSCRCALPESAASSVRIASGAAFPERSSVSPIGPKDSLVEAWVAIAPTPSSWVTESYATMEKVARAGGAHAASAAAAPIAIRRVLGLMGGPLPSSAPSEALDLVLQVLALRVDRGRPRFDLDGLGMVSVAEIELRERVQDIHVPRLEGRGTLGGLERVPEIKIVGRAGPGEPVQHGRVALPSLQRTAQNLRHALAFAGRQIGASGGFVLLGVGEMVVGAVKPFLDLE